MYRDNSYYCFKYVVDVMYMMYLYICVVKE